MKYFLAGVAIVAVSIAAYIMTTTHIVPNEIKPYAVIAVKDCGHLMGVLIIDQTGEIHNMPGPFDAQTKAGIADLAHKVPDQKKNLATIDMPCHADGDKTPQGGGTDT